MNWNNAHRTSNTERRTERRPGTPFDVRRSLSGVRCFPASARAAFTLIEVVISSALMAMIVVSAYLCFSASVAGQKMMEPRLEVIQNARVALALMSADFRAACPLDRNSEFIGMHRMLGETVADNVDFATHNYIPQRPREGDFCEASYYLDRDPQSGQLALWRRRNPTIAPNPLSGGSKEQIALGVRGLRFEYFDGLDWYDAWGDVDGRGKAQASQQPAANASGMPEAVRITLWFDSERRKPSEEPSAEDNAAPPLVFQTIARIMKTASASSSSSAASGANSDTGAQASPSTGGQPN